MFSIIKQFKKAGKVEIDYSELDKIKAVVKDNDFISFIAEFNGGSILKNSLQFYGVLPSITELEINYNTYLFNKYYHSMVDVALVFAEDVFGNQYCFMNDGTISFINLETAEILENFENFKTYLNKIETDIDYYSGFSVVEKWIEKFGQLDQFERLAPIKPFVIGGDYSIDNFHKLEKEKLFDYFSFIANQIRNLPDGTPIRLKVN